MHEYYKKNSMKFKKQMNTMFKLIRNEIEDTFSKPYNEVFEEIWEFYYDNIMEKFPYIGGDNASGTKNLTGAYYFVALGEVGKKYKITIEQWGKMITISFERYFEKTPKFAKRVIKRISEKSRFVEMLLLRKDKKNMKNAIQYLGSFETKTQTPTEEYPINFHVTVCPLYEFAKQNNYLEYMPYLCNLDYAMFNAFDIPLYREKTLASGDKYCDFKIKKGGKIEPAYPPHILRDNDPLK